MTIGPALGNKAPWIEVSMTSKEVETAEQEASASKSSSSSSTACGFTLFGGGCSSKSKRDNSEAAAAAKAFAGAEVEIGFAATKVIFARYTHPLLFICLMFCVRGLPPYCR